VHNRTCGCAVRSSHDRTCDEKKLKFFFCPFSSRFDPFHRVSFPRTKTIFFLPKKKYPCGKNSVIDNLVKQGMSSPGTSKTSRPMTPLSKDYHTAVSEMDTNNLLRSTLTDDCRAKKGDQRTCLICGLRYFWRPSRCRTHLGLAGSTKQVVPRLPRYPPRLYHLRLGVLHHEVSPFSPFGHTWGTLGVCGQVVLLPVVRYVL
jgi:hypothetical protein